MKTILIDKSNDKPRLYIGSTSTPKPGPREILVQHKATALNRADLLQKLGLYNPPKGESPILGLEMAGVVVDKGNHVTKWEYGDTVFGLLPGGGYAEYSILHEEMAIAKPDNLTFVETAGIAETFLTAYQALFWLGKLQQDEHVLIHAGASGVGTSAIQLARYKTSDIYVTASEEQKIDQCLAIGARKGINYKENDFQIEIERFTDGQGVDLIIDFIAAEYWNRNLQSLATDGRLVMLALLGGHKLNTTSLIPMLKKRLTIKGTTLRNRPLDYKIQLTNAFQSDYYEELARGNIAPVIDSVYPWQQAEEAHQRMENNLNTGKIILEIDSV